MRIESNIVDGALTGASGSFVGYVPRSVFYIPACVIEIFTTCWRVTFSHSFLTIITDSIRKEKPNPPGQDNKCFWYKCTLVQRWDNAARRFWFYSFPLRFLTVLLPDTRLVMNCFRCNVPVYNYFLIHF